MSYSAAVSAAACWRNVGIEHLLKMTGRGEVLVGRKGLIRVSRSSSRLVAHPLLSSSGLLTAVVAAPALADSAGGRRPWEARGRDGGGTPTAPAIGREGERTRKGRAGQQEHERSGSGSECKNGKMDVE